MNADNYLASSARTAISSRRRHRTYSSIYEGSTRVVGFTSRIFSIHRPVSNITHVSIVDRNNNKRSILSRIQKSWNNPLMPLLIVPAIDIDSSRSRFRYDEPRLINWSIFSLFWAESDDSISNDSRLFYPWFFIRDTLTESSLDFFFT